MTARSSACTFRSCWLFFLFALIFVAGAGMPDSEVAMGVTAKWRSGVGHRSRPHARRESGSQLRRRRPAASSWWWTAWAATRPAKKPRRPRSR